MSEFIEPDFEILVSFLSKNTCTLICQNTEANQTGQFKKYAQYKRSTLAIIYI